VAHDAFEFVRQYRAAAVNTEVATAGEPQRKKALTLVAYGLDFISVLAPRPGLEPGTYGLTELFWRNKRCSLEINKDK
jgi:hypothetical protein